MPTNPNVITLPTNADEVSSAQYEKSIIGVQRCSLGMMTADPDEVAQYWLPTLTEHIAIIFAYIGCNMTGRMVPILSVTQQAMEAAKDCGSVQVTQPPTQET